MGPGEREEHRRALREQAGNHRNSINFRSILSEEGVDQHPRNMRRIRSDVDSDSSGDREGGMRRVAGLEVRGCWKQSVHNQGFRG